MMFFKLGSTNDLSSFNPRASFTSNPSERFQQDLLTRDHLQSGCVTLGKCSLFSEVLCQPSATIYLGPIPLHAKHCKNAKAYNWHIVIFMLPAQPRMWT